MCGLSRRNVWQAISANTGNKNFFMSTTNCNYTKEKIYSILDNNVPGERSDKTRVFAQPSIYFEKISMDGLEEMHAYSIKEQLYEYIEFKPFKTIDETADYLNKLLDRIDSAFVGRCAMYWFVRSISDSRLIGTIGLVDINYDRKSAMWGYGIDPAYWGKGFILEMQECVKEYAFMQLRLNRIYGTTMIHNEPTKASILAAGGKNEGILRQFYCKDGKFIDAWAYSLLRDEYREAVRKKNVFERSRSECENMVVEIISTVIGRKGVNIDCDMESIHEWDSMNHFQIILAIERQTFCKFTPEDISQARSVRSICDILLRK